MERREAYAGIIRTPDAWWLSTSKVVYDAWDMDDCPARDIILSAAEQGGILIRIGPATMSTGAVFAAARRAFGEEVLPENAFDGITVLSDKGQRLIDGAGEFAPDYDDGQEKEDLWHSRT